MQFGHECGQPEHQLSRRRVLGTLAGAALGLGGIGRAFPAPAPAATDPRQVLFIWLDGGMSQLESWDPKPGTEFGGPFRSIETSVPGVRISELMPDSARQMHHLAVVRGMSTKDENHSTGVARMQRGDPKARGVDYPFLGAAVSKLMPPPANDLPPYLWIKPGSGGFIWQEGGFLGARYGALALGDGKPPIHIHRPETLGDESDAARQALRLRANARFRQGRRSAEIDAYESSYEVALKLMRRRELFDDSTLTSADVARYGTHPLGRHLLQARRLIEAGVRFVKVTSYHWDTHGDNFEMHRQLVPQIDRPFAALIDDLATRGLLDRVLVVLMSEFGRTPKINQRIGRDHWPEAWSLALAGCGLKRGTVVGATTPDGVYVARDPCDVGHLFHTVFRVLGIDPSQTEYDNHGQPLPIARDDCSAITALLA